MEMEGVSVWDLMTDRHGNELPWAQLVQRREHLVKMTHIPTIKKITTPELREEVSNLAIIDNDNMQYPTHAVYKNDEIVGGWNVGGFPLLLCWHDSNKVSAKDSMMINATMDSMMDSAAHPIWWMACNSGSPYYRHVEKLGFKHIWPTNIIIKGVS
tara:strand:+ start:892 stop:1359 length:468 start_codon:yes stop_codon:yes gene_type:complete